MGHEQHGEEDTSEGGGEKDPLLQYFDEQNHHNDDENPVKKALLTGAGHCRIQSVLTKTECGQAMDLIWDFLHDTSYGRIVRDDPASTTFDDFLSSPSSGMFQNNGAGWLLGDVRELLAERVFGKLYGTRELHCSKEGFLFRKRPTTSTPEGGERSYICLPPEISQSQNPRATIRTMIVLEGGYGLLERGDVFVWRSDLPAPLLYVHSVKEEEEESSSSRFVALAFCSMLPARLTPPKANNLKIDAYKQRQTGDHRLDVENWCDHHYSGKGSSPSTLLRPFFRTSPPLVTFRQAELYGLVPYGTANNDNQEEARPKGDGTSIDPRRTILTRRIANTSANTSVSTHTTIQGRRSTFGSFKHRGRECNDGSGQISWWHGITVWQIHLRCARFSQACDAHSCRQRPYGMDRTFL